MAIACLVSVAIFAPNAAMAATVQSNRATSTEKKSDDRTIGLSTVIYAPDATAKLAATRAIENVRSADPSGFEARKKLVLRSPKTMAYLTSFTGLRLNEQVEGLASLMPADALTGFTQMMDEGVLDFRVQVLERDVFNIEMIAQRQNTMQTKGLGALPRCASAWAAFWAWFAVNVTTCGAFAPFPVAAFFCAAGFAVGGAIIDFNMSC